MQTEKHTPDQLARRQEAAEPPDNVAELKPDGDHLAILRAFAVSPVRVRILQQNHAMTGQCGRIIQEQDGWFRVQLDGSSFSAFFLPNELEIVGPGAEVAAITLANLLTAIDNQISQYVTDGQPGSWETASTLLAEIRQKIAERSDLIDEHATEHREDYV